MFHLKEKIKLYIDLMRLNKPFGIFLLLIPCLWALAFSSNGNIPLEYIVTFVLGSILMRSAGCIINDIFDRNIDKYVERTKNRPLASGKMSICEAFIISMLCSIASFFLILFYMPLESIIISILSLPFICIYPTTKRYFVLPQLVLGIIFNIGVFVAWLCFDNIRLSAFVLYVGCIFWTLGYDTIYAMSDVKDDIKQKINSSAVFFGKNTKIFISICYLIFISSLVLIGVLESLSYFYYIGVASYLIAILFLVKDLIYNPSYIELFNRNVYHGMLFWIFILLCF